MFIAGPEKFGLEVNQEQREAHGELRENVVKRDGECEVEPMDPERLFHPSPSDSQRNEPPAARKRLPLLSRDSCRGSSAKNLESTTQRALDTAISVTTRCYALR
jgi:hypothetical protein